MNNTEESSLFKEHLEEVERVILRRYGPEGHLGEMLVFAANRGYLDVVRHCVENKGARADGTENLAIIGAASGGYLEVVRYLQSQGADLHSGEEDALCCAVMNGYFNVVKYCLEQGVDVNAGQGYALLVSIIYDQEEMMEYLFSQGADLDLAMKGAKQNQFDQFPELMTRLEQILLHRSLSGVTDFKIKQRL